MTQISYPWEFTSPGDAGPYSSAQWSNAWKTLFNGALAAQSNVGILPRSGNGLNDALLVEVTSPATNQVRIYPGAALVQGRYYESDATELITIAVNSDPDDRIDRIVLQIIFADQTIRIARLQGTPAAVPVAPTLTQDTITWEIPLAQVEVPSGFLSISTVTDERESSTLPTTMGGTSINSLATPYAKGDLIVALSAHILNILSLGAVEGMRLAIDTDESLGVKWLNTRPSIVSNNSGGAPVTVSDANLIFDTIVVDQAENISSVNGSGYIIPEAGIFKFRGLVSWRHGTAATTGIGQLVLYDNNAAANINDVSGALVSSIGNDIVNALSGGGTAEFPEHVIEFNGTEQLSYKIVTGYGTGVNMRRTKNPIFMLERLK